MDFSYRLICSWPAGIGLKGNAGDAGVLRNTPGEIGYVNQS